MTGYKVRLIRLPADEETQLERLNKLGADGWQLVGVLPANNGDVMAYVQQPESSVFTGLRGRRE